MKNKNENQHLYNRFQAKTIICETDAKQGGKPRQKLLEIQQTGRNHGNSKKQNKLISLWGGGGVETCCEIRQR